MLIGELATAAGVSIQTLRYYERRGFLTPLLRRPSGYREYGRDAVGVVRFIKRAQALGFSLSEVQQLLKLRRLSNSPPSRREAQTLARSRIADVDARIADLTRIRRALSELVDSCASGRTLHCPILETLSGEMSVRT
jgi:DNA-binding transcriptional MerR regulator